MNIWQSSYFSKDLWPNFPRCFFSCLQNHPIFGEASDVAAYCQRCTTLAVDGGFGDWKQQMQWWQKKIMDTFLRINMLTYIPSYPALVSRGFVRLKPCGTWMKRSLEGRRCCCWLLLNHFLQSSGPFANLQTMFCLRWRLEKTSTEQATKRCIRSSYPPTLRSHIAGNLRHIFGGGSALGWAPLPDWCSRF